MSERSLRASRYFQGLTAVCAALVLAGCGARSSEHAAESNTNWLGACDRDADCGDPFACVCGVCTKNCDELSCPDALECLEVSGCGESIPSCQASCDRDADCAAFDPDAECDDGVCAVPGNGLSTRELNAVSVEDATDADDESRDGGVSGSEEEPEDDAGAGPIASEPVAEGPGVTPVIDPSRPVFACDAVRSQQFDSVNMSPYSVSAEVTAEVDNTLALMGSAQKATQLMGVDGTLRNYRDIQRSPDVEVPGLGVVRGLRFRDAPRGVNLDAAQDNRQDDQNNFATAFPAVSLRAASWDLELERRVGAAIGDETAAARNNVAIAAVLDLVRHPYWGRTQDTYGEDAYHMGRMATAFTVGVQEYVMACGSHFVANNIERARSRQNAVMNEQTLREIYARPFEVVVQDGGLACVMAAYNLVNGVKATQNAHLLRDVLKGPASSGGIGFEGFVLTDWWAMPGDQNWPDAATAQTLATEAIMAGTDVEVPWTLHYNEATLANVDQVLLEDAARRVLTQKYRFGSALDTDPWSKQPPTSTLSEGSIAPNETHEALAEEAALKSMVLLTNGASNASAPVLPLSSAVSIAVVGPVQEFSQISSSAPKSCTLSPDVGSGQMPNPRTCTFRFATDPALGDRGANRVNADPSRSIGPFAGIQEAAASARLVTSGNSAEAASSADAVVVVVGYTPGDEGEEYYIADGGDRDSLNLPPGHNELVNAVLDLNKPTVIVIESGSIVNLPWLTHPNQNQATIWAGYPGMRGGLALGKLIFGEANFSGKLPMAWPAESELQPFKDSETSTTMGYFFGYRAYDQRRYVEGTPVEMVFPFGHGLSYAVYEYANLTVPCGVASKEAIVEVSVDITNTLSVDGEEVAMLFVKPPPKPGSVTGERPWKELKSFTKVAVPAGQTVTAKLPLRIRDLRRWEGDETGGWVIDEGDYTLMVGKNADDAENASTTATITVGSD